MIKPVCLKSACKRLNLLGRHFLQRHCSSAHGKKSFGLVSHYDILGVDREASADDIRDAFLKLSKECHPDINSHDPKTHDKFVQVNEAYSVLSKALSRRDYDLSLNARESSRSPYHYGHPGTSTQRPFGDDAQSHFHDPYIYNMRDKSQDKYYEHQPYYGIKGINRVSNKHIVLTCFGIIVVGCILHYLAVKKSSSLHIKNLDERDVKSHKLWLAAHDPTLFNQKLQELKEKNELRGAKKGQS